jgi:hypothetical protein
LSLDTSSIRSGTDTIRTEGEGVEDDTVEDEGDGDDLAGMVDVDLLGGLAGGELFDALMAGVADSVDDDVLPATRLASSVRQDLSIPPMNASTSTNKSGITPFVLPSSTSSNGNHRGDRLQTQTTPPVSAIALRKSFRRVLSLSSGLKVRMRTLFLPQLLPVHATHGDDNESEAERRIVLCVEVENPIDSSGTGFEVERITVDVGGKGAKASASLVCQPGQSISSTGEDIFPLRLEAVEQYNLLYAVTIASTPETRSGQGLEEAISKTLGKGDEQRPVSIIVLGRPYLPENVYPTSSFSSRWNCTLDLTTFYANMASNLPPPPLSAQRMSKPAIPPPNAIAGDKRYSLATLLSTDAANRPPIQQSQRLVSATGGRPPVQPPNSRIMSSRFSLPNPIPNQTQSQVVNSNPDAGLLISVKVLEPENGRRKERVIRALEPFSLEVFVANRTEEIRRFRLSVPNRDEEVVGRVREVEQRRRKKSGYSDIGVDESGMSFIIHKMVEVGLIGSSVESDVGKVYGGCTGDCFVGE